MLVDDYSRVAKLVEANFNIDTDVLLKDIDEEIFYDVIWLCKNIEEVINYIGEVVVECLPSGSVKVHIIEQSTQDIDGQCEYVTCLFDCIPNSIIRRGIDRDVYGLGDIYEYLKGGGITKIEKLIKTDTVRDVFHKFQNHIRQLRHFKTTFIN